MANVVHFIIEHYQMYTHHHTARVAKVVEAYHQVHGFNDDGL
jgi:hypothetical protein